MDTLKVSWAELKLNAAAKTAPLQYIEKVDLYVVLIADGVVTLYTHILKTSPAGSDQTDFEDNYKATSNKRLAEPVALDVSGSGSALNTILFSTQCTGFSVAHVAVTNTGWVSGSSYIQFETSVDGSNWDVVAFTQDPQSTPPYFQDRATTADGAGEVAYQKYAVPLSGKYFRAKIKQYTGSPGTISAVASLVAVAAPTTQQLTATQLLDQNGNLISTGQATMVQSIPVVIASDQDPIPITGTIDAANPSVSDTGAAVPAQATMVGGSDGTNLRALKVSVTGMASVDGSGVTQPISAVALPLPTGAASETTLAAVLAAVDGVEALLTSIGNNTDGLEGFVDGIEALIGATNSLLTAIGNNTDQLEGYSDGIEGLLTQIRDNADTVETLLTNIGNNTDQLEGFVDGVETLLTSIRDNADTLEALVTAGNASLSAIAANQTNGN